MHLSQRTKYALRALDVLAREWGQGPLLTAQLAEREQIPRKFLEAILLELNNRGVLSSKRGRGGGYQLRKKPEEITLGEVVRIFDGPLAPTPCVSDTAFRPCDDCRDAEACGIRMTMRQVRDQIALVLDKTTLADVRRQVEEAVANRGKDPMYHI
jgi:Rrf2 family protein